MGMKQKIKKSKNRKKIQMATQKKRDFQVPQFSTFFSKKFRYNRLMRRALMWLNRFDRRDVHSKLDFFSKFDFIPMKINSASQFM